MATLRELTVGLNIQTDQGALTNIVQILGRMENIMRSVAKGMEAVEDQADDTADAIDDVGSAADKTEKKLDKTTKTGNNFRKKLGEIATGAVKVAAGLLTLDAIKGVFSWVTGISKGAHALSDQAETLNSTIESYQRLSFISGRAGVDQGAFASGLKKTSETITQAADKTSEMSKLYDQLGISVTNADGSLRGSADVMQDLQKAYQSDSVGNLDKIYKILGGSLNENINLFKLTEDEYKALNDQATKNGIITQEQADVAKKLNDTFSNLTAKVSSFATKIMSVLGPALILGIDMVEDLLDAVLRLTGFVKTDNSMKDWAWKLEKWLTIAWNHFVDFYQDAYTLFLKLKRLYQDNEDDFVRFAKAFAAAITVTMIPALKSLTLAWGKSILSGLMVGAKALLSHPVIALLAAIVLIFTNLYLKITEDWERIKDDWSYLWDKIVGVWDKFVARVMRIWNEFVDWIIGSVYRIYDAVNGVWEDIKSAGSAAVDYLIGVWDKFFNFLGSGWDKAKGLLSEIPLVGGFFKSDGSSKPTEGTLSRSAMGNTSVSETTVNNTVGAINVTSTQADPKLVAKEVRKEINKALDDGGKTAALANNKRRR